MNASCVLRHKETRILLDKKKIFLGFGTNLYVLVSFVPIDPQTPRLEHVHLSHVRAPNTSVSLVNFKSPRFEN